MSDIMSDFLASLATVQGTKDILHFWIEELMKRGKSKEEAIEELMREISIYKSQEDQLQELERIAARYRSL